MKKTIAIWAAAMISMLGCIGSLQAHHSASMFDLLTPIWVEAAFVRFDRVNPHSRITLEETTEDGRTVQWTVEGPALFQLDRSGIDLSLNAGDIIEVCAFALKEGFSSRQPPLGYGRSSPPFVHGHVLVMPDGEKRLWGSYGRLGECIRTKEDEQIESWLDFLNTDRARNRWCEQRTYSRQVTAVSKAFVEEINSLMTNPCE